MLDEVGQVDVRSIDEFGVEAYSFAEYRIGHRDRRRDRDRRVGHHGVLDLRRADVLAASQDEVGCSAGDAQIAVRIDLADVAHSHPPVAGEELVVVGPTEVAEAGRGTAARRLTPPRLRDVPIAVEEPDRHFRHDPPAGAQSASQRVIYRRPAEQPGFVRPVELQNLGTGQFLELGGGPIRQRLAAREDHA